MHHLLRVTGGCLGRTLLKSTLSKGALKRPQIRMHHDEYTKPFDNMPFSVSNRYVLTGAFCVIFGVGWWAPWWILWYSMAKGTM